MALNFRLSAALLFLLAGLSRTAEQANLAPSVDEVPFHLVNLDGDLLEMGGAGTQFANFSAQYPAELSGDQVNVLDANGDSVVLRMRLDSALNVRSSSIDTPATALFEVVPYAWRHVSAMYVSANCFNITSEFLDSAVLNLEVYFSRGTDKLVFNRSLLLGRDIRNYRLNKIDTSSTPVSPPTNPNVTTLSNVNDRFLDLIKIPLDTSYISYRVDSIRVLVPRRRKVFIQNGTALHVDGGTRIHAISFATNYEFSVFHFSQGDPAWTDSLLNNIAGKRMGAVGCAVTSSTMLLHYYGIHTPDGSEVNPLNFLQWENANGGFVSGTADFQWGSVANFSVAAYNTDNTQARLHYDGPERDIRTIEQRLSMKTPMLLRVRSRSVAHPDQTHFVLARGIAPKQDVIGMLPLRGTYLLADPGGNFETLQSYLQNGGQTPSSANPPNRFIQVQRYSVVSDPNVDFSWLTIQLHSPAELLITDPLGRRLGMDPQTSDLYEEIPQGTYSLAGGLADDEGGSNSTEEFKEATIIAPVDGQYQVQVVGTGTGAYKVTRSFSRSDGGSIVHLPAITGTTSPGQVDDYSFELRKGVDAEPPKLVVFSFAPAAVEVRPNAAVVTASLKVTDDVSGVARAAATFVSPSHTDSLTAEGTLVFGSTVDGTFAKAITVPADAETGMWHVSKVYLEDAAGKSVTLTTDQLAASGFPTSLEVGSAEKNAHIDIRPGEYPNVINLKSKGIVPVAILSDTDFDARDVDPATVRLSGASAKIQKGAVKVIEQDVNQDGLTDIVLQMITEELQLDKNSTHAVLTGKTKSGTAIRGIDSVVVVQIRE